MATAEMPPRVGRRSLRITQANNGFILNVTEEGDTLGGSTALNSYKSYDMVFISLPSLLKATRTFLETEEEKE